MSKWAEILWGFRKSISKKKKVLFLKKIESKQSLQIDLDLIIMIWSPPKWNGHDQNELVRSKLSFSKVRTWPIHFGRDPFILVITKSLWSSPNQFGGTKTTLDRPKLFWSYRRTRHKFRIAILLIDERHCEKATIFF